MDRSDFTCMKNYSLSQTSFDTKDDFIMNLKINISFGDRLVCILVLHVLSNVHPTSNLGFHSNITTQIHEHCARALFLLSYFLCFILHWPCASLLAHKKRITKNIFTNKKIYIKISN
jgi:hypothetical protein